MRNQYFDFLRGLSILMVIGVHTLTNCNFNSTLGTINVGIRQILNCAVPIFLAISGFFLANKHLDTKQDCFTFYKTQIFKIYLPCLLWSLPLYMLSLYSGKSVLLSSISLFICGYSVYYFVALIIQYYFLLPILQRVSKLRGGGY